MGRKIKLRLSTQSVEDAIRQLEEYKVSLRFKVSLFVQKLAELGIQTIESNKYSYGDSDFNDLRSYVWLDEMGDTVKATLILSGKDVAFIEFGAGVHYNGGGSPNPLGQQLGMTIGSYGLGNGLNDSWVYHDDETNQFVTSYGTKAAMPMYQADQEIRNNFLSVAKEVFNNG